MKGDPILNQDDLKKELKKAAGELLNEIIKTMSVQGVQLNVLSPESTDNNWREVIIDRMVEVLFYGLSMRLATAQLTDRANCLAYAAGGMPFERSKPDKDNLMARVLEEAGELAEVVLTAMLLAKLGSLAGATKSYFGRPTRPDVPAGDLKKVHDELGDVGVIWLRICHVFGADPMLVISASLDKFAQRLKDTGVKTPEHL